MALLQGWRSFGLSSDGTLMGALGHRWNMVETRAACFEWEDAHGVATEELQVRASAHLTRQACNCGLAATFHPRDMFAGSWYWHGPFIVAHCVGWGHVIYGSKGFRAEYMRIETVLVPYSKAFWWRYWPHVERAPYRRLRERFASQAVQVLPVSQRFLRELQPFAPSLDGCRQVPSPSVAQRLWDRFLSWLVEATS